VNSDLHYLHDLHHLPETSLDFLHEGNFGELLQVMQVMQVLEPVGLCTGHVTPGHPSISLPGAARLVVRGVSNASCAAEYARNERPSPPLTPGIYDEAD